MGAFNNSPGGCCCEINNGWFDCYSWKYNANPDVFQRAAESIYPVGVTSTPFASKAHGGWSIGTTPYQTTRAFCRNDNRVWAQRTGNASALLDVYDSIAKIRINSMLVSSLPTAFAGAAPQTTSTPLTEFVSLDDYRLVVGTGTPTQVFINDQAVGINGYLVAAQVAVKLLSDTGNLEQWSASDSFYRTSTLNPATTWNDTTIQLVSRVCPLDWPKSIGMKVNGSWTNVGATYTWTPYIAFTFGDLSRSGQGGTLATGGEFKRHTGHSITAVSPGGFNLWPSEMLSMQGGILGFDSFNGTWCAAIWYETESRGNDHGYALQPNPVNRRLEIYVNGQVAMSYEFPPDSTFVLPPIAVHVCRDHETLGGGYVAIICPSFTTPPGPSNPNGVGADTSLFVFKNNALQWQRPVPNTAKVWGSSDRWIYLDAYPSLNIQTFSGGKFSGNGANDVSRQWLIKPDGTENIPCGVLTETNGTIATVGSTWTTPHEMVKSSAVIPDVLPKSYDEMWTNRHSN